MVYYESLFGSAAALSLLLFFFSLLVKEIFIRNKKHNYTALSDEPQQVVAKHSLTRKGMHLTVMCYYCLLFYPHKNITFVALKNDLLFITVAAYVSFGLPIIYIYTLSVTSI